MPFANITATPEEGSLTDVVTADESTSSTSYTNLTTTGPRVTVNVPRSGKLLVIWRVESYGSTNGFSAPELSGANTYAANGGDAANSRSASLQYPTPGLKLFTGLNPGSTTVTLKYRTGSGTGNFYNRHMIVLPL